MQTMRSASKTGPFFGSLLTALAFVPFLGLAGCSQKDGVPRNVILITLDTTRPDFLGAWGKEGNPTPHLDALAADGIRFETAISSSAVTPVSHASILTGRHQYQHGLRILAGAGGFQLPEDVPTLATTLKSRGYATAAFHSAFPVSAVYGFNRDFDIFEDVGGSGLNTNEEGAVSWDVSQGQRRSDATTNMVLDFLSSTEQPFFIWIHYWDPHDGFLLPPTEFLNGRMPVDDQGQAKWNGKAYGLEVSYMDQQFGRLIQGMKDGGQYADTLISVVADHGEGLEDGMQKHGWSAHRILYQEQIHVPLILRIPGAARGRSVSNMVRSVDIYPTVLDYLDIAPEGVLGGSSLRALIEGREEAGRVAYADQINLWDANAKMLQRRPQADFLHVLMNDQWKLIYRPRNPKTSELYDYRKDPAEQQNLFTRKIEVSKRLMQDLAGREPWVLAPPEPSGAAMAEGSLETLGKLGYTAGAVEMSSEAIAEMWEWLCPEAWHRLQIPGTCPEHGVRLLPARRSPN
ncbi:MAG: arylsulfatase [Candidatus Paceibacteria bacterium]|jgi:arylsulfatase